MDIVTNGTRQRRKPGRRPRYPNPAARQSAYRQRRDLREEVFDTFRQELRDAIARGRGSWKLEHGPDEPTAWLVWATERLSAVRLVPYPRAPGEGKRLSRAATAVLTALLAGATVTVDGGRVSVGGRVVPRQTWEMLVTRGYVIDGRLTDAGGEALEKERKETI